MAGFHSEVGGGVFGERKEKGKGRGGETAS